MVVSLIGASEKDSVDFKSVILVFGERNNYSKEGKFILWMYSQSIGMC